MKKFALLAFAVLLAFSCKKEEDRQIDRSYMPDVNIGRFKNSTNLTNPYLPFAEGKTYVFEGQTAEGTEKIEVKRTPATKLIMGITCIVVNDKVWLDGNLIEDTDDWYAQDTSGNVWYMGEFVKNYRLDGTFEDNDGSWEAGVDGALPGIAMHANPKPGLHYRQEYYFDEAEDEAEVLETGLSVTVPVGTFQNCIKTHDFTALEPDLHEHKFYALGIGMIKEFDVTNGETIQLIEIKQ